VSVAGQLLAAVMAAATLAAPLATADETPVDVGAVFDSACLGRPDAEGAFAIARSLGFKTPPRAMQTLLSKSPEMSNAKMLWKVGDGVLVMIFAADRSEFKGGDMGGALCGVAVMPSDPALDQALERRLGLGPGETASEGYRVLMYSEIDGRRARLDSRRFLAAARLIEKQQLHLVMYGAMKPGPESEATMMVHLKPRPN
jgi:hypothetical protein